MRPCLKMATRLPSARSFGVRGFRANAKGDEVPLQEARQLLCAPWISCCFLVPPRDVASYGRRIEPTGGATAWRRSELGGRPSRAEFGRGVAAPSRREGTDPPPRRGPSRARARTSRASTDSYLNRALLGALTFSLIFCQHTHTLIICKYIIRILIYTSHCI